MQCCALGGRHTPNSALIAPTQHPHSAPSPMFTGALAGVPVPVHASHSLRPSWPTSSNTPKYYYQSSQLPEKRTLVLSLGPAGLDLHVSTQASLLLLLLSSSSCLLLLLCSPRRSNAVIDDLSGPSAFAIASRLVCCCSLSVLACLGNSPRCSQLACLISARPHHNDQF